MNYVWMVLRLGVIINVSSCLSSSNSNVNITPYSEFFYYTEGEILSFLCKSDISRINESRWLFIYPVDDFREVVETEGTWVYLTLQASDNGSRLLCYHRIESGPPYLNYSDVITFVIDESFQVNTGLIAAGSIAVCFIATTMLWFFWRRHSQKNKVASLMPETETYINQAIINRYQPPAATASAPASDACSPRTVDACPVTRVTNHGYSHVYGNTDKHGKVIY